jgi:U4/U6.U5 tri-snRNP-associated protein 2
MKRDREPDADEGPAGTAAAGPPEDSPAKRQRAASPPPTAAAAAAAAKAPAAPPAEAAAANGGNAKDGDDGDDARIALPRSTTRSAVVRGRECPYLDTVCRQALDFDFEKCCSVSLSPLNVYACLVCGRYFAGRGLNTHAFTHALEAGHHMFMKLDTGRVYCLPENYEVADRSLDDVRAVLNPKFTRAQVLCCGFVLLCFGGGCRWWWLFCCGW